MYDSFIIFCGKFIVCFYRDSLWTILRNCLFSATYNVFYFINFFTNFLLSSVCYILAILLSFSEKPQLVMFSYIWLILFIFSFFFSRNKITEGVIVLFVEGPSLLHHESRVQETDEHHHPGCQLHVHVHCFSNMRKHRG